MYVRCIYSISVKEISKYTVIYGAHTRFCQDHVYTVFIQYFWQGISKYTCKYTVIYGAYTRFCQNHVYTVYIQYLWQGNPQIYGHIRCTYMVLSEPCIHGVYTVFLARKSPNIRSYTVRIHGSGQPKTEMSHEMLMPFHAFHHQHLNASPHSSGMLQIVL